MIKFFLLGRPYIEVDGKEIHLSRRKNLALLAYLALATEARRREELIALLWPELDTYHAQTALRRDLWVLKGKGIGDYLRVTHDSVALQSNSEVWCDVTTFQKMLTANRLKNRESQPLSQDQIEPLVSAVQLYRDDFMRGFSLRDSPLFDEWQIAQSEALRHQLTVALEILIDAYTEHNPHMAINYAQRMLEVDPLYESTHYRLMNLLIRVDRPAAAIQQFKRCAHLLAENLDATPSAHITQLYEQIQSNLVQSHQRQSANSEQVAADASVLSSAIGIPTIHFPAPPTPFVGRTDELAQIIQLFSIPECRLLTLLGPGGIGKTRLAIAAGHQLQTYFADGIYFVSLASLRHPELLAPAILEALGVMRQADRAPEETLMAYLNQRQLLLVLDNFEHLLAGSSFIERILQKNNAVKILITTRERLNLAAEWLLPISGMPYPVMRQLDAGIVDIMRDPVTIDDSGYDSVQFFVQCAQRVQPTLTFTQRERQAITTICQLVEGIPLAIELAASWLNTLSCAAIADALRSGMDILTNDQSGVIERQRSIHATLDYSWRLAKPAEQIVLAKLAVFHGGFLPNFAQSVADADPTMLRSLVDKSWLHRLPNDRLEMHKLIRQFCEEKLESGRLDPQTIRSRHSRSYGNFMQQRQAELCDYRQIEAVQAIIAERGNLRSAWENALAMRNEETLDDLLESFYIVGLIRNWHAEMIALFEQSIAVLASKKGKSAKSKVITQSQKHPLLLPRLRARLGNYLAGLGKMEQANVQLEKALVELKFAGLQGTDHQEWITEYAFVLAQQSIILATVGRYIAGQEKAQEALSLLSTANGRYTADTHAEATQEEAPQEEVDETIFYATRAMAQCRFAIGEQSEAIKLLTDVAAKLRSRGELWLRAKALTELVFFFRVKNETANVRHYTQERMMLCQSLGDQLGVAHCLEDLGYSALFADTLDMATAQDCFDQLARLNKKLKNPTLHDDLLFGLGQIAYFKQEWEEARRNLEESYAFHHETNALHGMTLAHLWLGEVALEEGKLAEARHRFSTVFKYAIDMQSIAVTLLGLEGLAKTSLRTGESERAATLLAMIAAHPNTWEFARGRVKNLLQELQSEMPNERFDAAIEKGNAMKLAEAINWGMQVLEHP